MEMVPLGEALHAFKISDHSDICFSLQTSTHLDNPIPYGVDDLDERKFFDKRPKLVAFLHLEQ